MQKLYSKPFIAFIPFLVSYAALIIILNDNTVFGDEDRYLMFAQNLLKGFYSPPPPQIHLWNGPGFPLYLVPFVALNSPLLLIKLCNAILHYFTLVIFYKTLRNFLEEKKSFICTAILGCYFMPFKSLLHILSESFTIFLIASITFLSVRYFSGQENNRKQFFLLSILLAFLALTKVIFGNVYPFAGIVFLICYFITRNNYFRKSFMLMFASLIFCIPYLIYTHSLTGKIFYWSNAAGMSLYWMSNPVQGEYGEWYNDSLTSIKIDQRAQEILQANHREEYNQIQPLSGVERDNKFKSFAIQHVKENPGKVFMNWLANISRMFFNYPVGYRPFNFRTVLNMIANIPLMLLLIFATWQTWKKKNDLHFALKFLLIITFIYLGGSSLLSAYDRMLYILIPVLGCWIVYSILALRKSESQVQVRQRPKQNDS